MKKLIYLESDHKDLDREYLYILNTIIRDVVIGVKFDDAYGCDEYYYTFKYDNKNYFAIFRKYHDELTKKYPLYSETLMYFIEDDENEIDIDFETESYLDRKYFYESDLW